jgi:hypothetical protein
VSRFSVCWLTLIRATREASRIVEPRIQMLLAETYDEAAIQRGQSAPHAHIFADAQARQGI